MDLAYIQQGAIQCIELFNEVFVWLVTPIPQGLTFEFVVLRVCREQAVWEELGEGEAGVLWPVLHVVADRGLQLLHELCLRRAQLLYDLVPLVDV